MTGVDPNNLFALLTTAIGTADAISQDTRQSRDSRDGAGRLRDALRSWKGLAFNYRDWTPVAVTPADGGAA